MFESVVDINFLNFFLLENIFFKKIYFDINKSK